MSRMMIEKRAYEIWEAEGRPTGRAEAHWQAAEREVTATPPASTADRGSETALERGTAVLGKPAAKVRAPRGAAAPSQAADGKTPAAAPRKAPGRRKREEP
ncbi:DUF2934 domain-containing protein [Phreatobacter cathodiphilus]|uniref:DUF2934 domain-containing protein n=1 Tax=Phreatobacter cathodiphilus TaxID=1868589 RepID=A0A2S0NI13_9HYPH|nr:DUF2934 domain-containing protein [Phreatobacter cathodiphilus]AVO47802.1 hypothetical protein C6569_20570 [Phreatobacter cathodiphilus]